MKTSFVTLVAAVLVPAIAAQQSAQDIEDDTRVYWCEQQIASCPLLCQDNNKTVTKNECFPKNLYFECTCSDGLTPDYDEYSQTIPYFQCSLTQQKCIADCGGASGCQDECKETYKCGAINPERLNATESSTATQSSTSSASTSTSTASSDEDEDEDDSSSSTGFAKSGSSSSSTDEDEEDQEEEDAGSAANALSPYGMGFFALGVAGVVALL